MISEMNGPWTYSNITFNKYAGPERRGVDTDRKGIKGPAAVADKKPEKPDTSDHHARGSHELEALKRKDRELHQNVPVHGTSLIYQTGPDGHIYASGRKVTLEASEVPNNPQATIDKAREIRRAVNSQKEPSLHDLHLLFAASRMEAQARAELMKQPGDIINERKAFVDKYV